MKEDQPPSHFPDLLALQEFPSVSSPSSLCHSDDRLYVSINKPFKPFPLSRSVYGGHFLAQSLHAASLSIAQSFPGLFVVAHSLHANFLARSSSESPFLYVVSTVQTGNRFLVRLVRVYQYPAEQFDLAQIASASPLFIATISFKTPEPSAQLFFSQSSIPSTSLPDEWHHIPPRPPILASPSKAIPHPDADHPGILAWAADNNYRPHKHAIDVRRVPMTTNPDAFSHRRSFHYYKAISHFVSRPSEDPNLHLCAHAYVSDRNSLFVSADLIGKRNSLAFAASLSHSIVFYPPPIAPAAAADEDWCVMETSTSRSGDGRLSYNGRLYDARGFMIAEFMQDGLAIFSSNL
ncbi:thioesterase-like superfamily-domain-containing protein [Lipomyces oligophaga]|uniref:thioesterase-like superfamily-domain-containing protein n=1 Tax=Lipomyces oligophaga TaxID=45792 RepID=UPI0034CD9EC8